MIGGAQKVLIERSRIAARVRELGRQIADDLRVELAREGVGLDEPGRVVLVPVLTGAIVFVADLIREMPMHMSMGVVSVSSYPGKATTSVGAAIRGALPDNIRGAHVIIVDDIYDSGQTLSLVQSEIRLHRPASLRTCVLLRKDAPRIAEADVEYVGFDIPNVFIVGYGLDHDGHYRNLPDIRELPAPQERA